jgi:hypothetical protein
MKKLLLLALFLIAASTGWAQDSQNVEHLFKVFYYDKDSIRIDIPENEHASTRLTGFLVHKAKIVLLGDKAKTELTNTDEIFIEVMDTVQLKPQFFRVMKMKVKKGNREATCWSNSPFGVNDSSSDFIPTTLYPIKENIYRIDINDMPNGHYFIMYQEGLSTLMELYDFDK